MRILYSFGARRPRAGHLLQSVHGSPDMQAGSRRSPGAQRGRRLLPAASGVLLALCVASNAQAFCRTRTCEFRADVDCKENAQTGCSSVGEFVKWSGRCISYAVQRDGSIRENISADQLESLVDAGFRSWSELSCAGGGSPELSAASQGPIACDAVEYDCTLSEGNSNLIMFRDDFSNMDSGLRFGVIALTTITANLVTGELFDADIEINSRDEQFTTQAGDGNNRQALDLRGVVNHELGHLLGLSHSRESGALMRAAYEGTALPGADDRAGICLALGSARTDPACEVAELGADAGCVGTDVSCTRARSVEEKPAAGCSCRIPARAQPASASLPWAWAGLFGLALCRWRSRRQKTVL
jgi:matrixin